MPLKSLLNRKPKNLYYTNWQWAWNTGIFVGNGEVWVYKTFPTTPLVWASDETRIQTESRLNNTFKGLAAVSREVRWAKLASRRRFHLLTVEYLAEADVSKEPPKLREYLDETIYPYLVPRKICFLGVQLQSKFATDLASLGRGPKDTDSQSTWKTLYEMIGDMGDRFAKDTPESLVGYHEDLETVENLLFSQGFSNPTPFELSVMQSWFQNPGGDGMPRLYEYPKYLHVVEVADDDIFWEISAITGWEDRLDESPWLALCNSLEESANVVSIRGELEKAVATRNRVKTQRRKLDESRYESAKSTEYERTDDEYLAQEMVEVQEYYYANADEPSVSSCSILMARRLFRDPDDPKRWAGSNQQTYMDEMRETYSIRSVVPPYQQRDCALEMTPCATIGIGSAQPFKHHLSLGVITNSGVTSFSKLGDAEGAHLGYAVPDETEVRLSYGAASAQNKSPVFLIAGKPGSGKTMVCQSLLDQAVRAEVNSIMVNPKGADSLLPLLSVTGGQHVMIGADTTPGTLDPFKFSEPTAAVNIAVGFLTTLLPTLDDLAVAEIEEGLRRADSPECMMEAISYIKNKEYRDMIKQLRRSNPIIGLCMADEGGRFALTAKKTEGEGSDGLLLVEFAADIGLPNAPQKISEMDRSERYAIGAVSLLMQAAMSSIVQARRGQLDSGKGSFLVIDEAWIMLCSKYMVNSYIEALARLGRSLDVTLVLATQRVSDIVSAGLTEYISRVLLMKLQSNEEQTLGLELLGLDTANQEFRDIMASSGSSETKDAQGRKIRLPPAGWHRDLNDNVGVIKTTLPDEVLDIYSTNPEEKAEMLRKMKAEEEEEKLL